MSVHETALSFGCAGETLLGIASHPAEGTAKTGVLIIVGGPQYRIGSHRQFTLLARSLAQSGYPVLRFDYRGMGDSSGVSPGFDGIDADVAAAIDALRTACPSVTQVVLWGLCDGASAALMYAQRSGDSRIVGLTLANPWLHTEQAEAHAIVHSYYRQRIFDAAFWCKLLGGGINPLRKLKELAGHWRNARTETEDEHAAPMLTALNKLNLPMLLFLSCRDATAQEFLAELKLAESQFLHRSHVQRKDFEQADHTFSRAEWRSEVENATIGWLNKHFPRA
jgi:uncharacterized protein